MYVAAENGHAEAVGALLAGGANPNFKGGFTTDTPLHVAAENGHAEAVRALLAGGANPNITIF